MEEKLSLLATAASDTGATGMLQWIMDNAEKLSIVTVLILIILGMGGLIWYMFKYFNGQLGERDKTIKEMTAVLLESNEVMTKLMNAVDDNRKDVLGELKIVANDLKTHITMTILGEKRNGSKKEN